MRPSLLQKMDVASRHTMPVLLTLALTLLSQVPTHIPALAGVMPPLALMGVYYWAIYRPDLFTAGTAFAIGFLQDLISGTPLGVSALVLLLAHGVAASQRRYFLGHGFLAVWWGFALVSAGAALASGILVSFLAGGGLDPKPVLFQYVLALFLFPPLARLIGAAHHHFLKEA